MSQKLIKAKDQFQRILVSNGLLKKGDFFVCGNTWGKVRAMIGHDGKMIDQAKPSTPVEILGMNSSVNAGADFLVTENEEKAKEIYEFRSQNSGQKINYLLKTKQHYLKKG